MTAVASAASDPSEATSTVGFVGLGMMGARVAGTLLSKGVPLVVHNRDASKAAPLLSRGASWAAHPSDVARQATAGVVFLMLSDGRAVERVLFGRGGVAAGAARGMTVVDLSTIEPADSREFAARLAPKGVVYLDAPVGGSIGPAERGELVVFAGGDAAALERVQPWLGKISVRVEHMGPIGAGASMKLVNNLMTVATIGLLSEALALGEAFSLDRARMLTLLRAGGGASVMLEAKRENLANRTYPASFLLPLARKDLRLIERAARRAGRPAPLTRETRRLYDEALNEGHEREDFSSVFEAARARTLGAARAPPTSPTNPASQTGPPP